MTGSKLTGDPDFDSLLEEVLKTLETKGADYTMGSKDRLHNFRTVGSFVDLSKEKVWSVYFYKHIAAIFNYIKSGGQSESEPIRGRIVDAIVYLLLFHKMVIEPTDWDLDEVPEEMMGGLVVKPSPTCDLCGKEAKTHFIGPSQGGPDWACQGCIDLNKATSK